MTDIPTINYEKYHLKNGLEVVLVEDHRLPVVAVDLTYHVGPAYEDPDRTGFAHLFEHMMFTGSKHVPRGLADSLLEAAGGDASNGSTSFDRTNYFETVPSHQLELDLWIHADRMGYLLDVLDQTALSNQQDVVRNERRESSENEPYGIVEEALWHNLFPKKHPYHGVIIGSHADIQSATLDDVKSFFKRYYRPNNATLVIVGDIDKAETKRLVEKYFAGLQRGDDIKPPTIDAPIIRQEMRAIVEDHVELHRVFMGWHTPQIFSPGDAEMTLAGYILGIGDTSRLHRSLVYEKQIAQDVSAYQYSLQLGSVFIIDVIARPGHTAAEIEAAINQELEHLRDIPITIDELQRARNSIEVEMFAGIESLSGMADWLNHYNHYTGNPGYFDEQINVYRGIEPQQVDQAIERYLKKDARVVIHGIPGEPELEADVPVPSIPVGTAGGEAINADEPWRQRVPQPAIARPLVFPAVESFQLANGLTIIHHYKPALPVVSAYLVFRSGSEANPPDKPGLISFMVGLLDKGTTTRSAMQIAEDVASLGASLSTSVWPDECAIELFSLNKKFADGMRIVADILLNPRFADDELERERASRIGELAQLREDATELAEIAGIAALYGFSHPYGHPVTGNEVAVKAISRDDIVQIWRKHFVPNNAALVVCGDITRDALESLAASLFAQWQQQSLVSYPSVEPQPTKARLVIVDKPGASQSALRVMTMGPKRQTADFAVLEVMNAALGGLFTSRINTNLREDKGYTYGASSDFVYQRMLGSFEICTSVHMDVTAAAVKEIFNELRNLRKKPIVGDELKKARDSQFLSLPGAFETSMDIAQCLANTFIHELGIDYYRELIGFLRQVDSEAVSAKVQEYLRPENMIVIVTGDKEKIEPALAALKLTPIEYRDAEGKVI